MAGAEQRREAMSTLRRDLLDPLVGGSQFSGGSKEAMRERGKEVEVEVEVELSLGLSLNGRFGVDPQRHQKLFRSSSDYLIVSETSPMRTASLPTRMELETETETETEERKRKEARPLWLMEAKKKRVELMSNVMRPQDQVTLCENGEENVGAQTRFSPPIDSRGHVLRHFGQTTWACEAIGGSAIAQGMEGLPPRPLSHAHSSVISLGSGSSGVSEFESHPIQEMSKYTESVSPARVQSHPPQNKQRPGLSHGKIKKTVRFSENLVDTPPARSMATENGGDEMAKNAMLDMPCVSTTGEGPDGKTIQGFLYQYRKGEEVRIVCVCHGNFLSPAEFVRHAGGRDVAHPLRQIVVNHSPLV